MYYVVIDGYALAYRAFHGYPELKTDKGRPCQVTVGFFRQVLSVLQRQELSPYKGAQLVFVFDSPSEVFRKKLDPAYKGNRSSAPDSFYQQVDEIVELCKLIGPTYQVPGFEADDLAGSFVSKLAPTDSAVLVTVDCDWLQLLQPNVKVFQLKTTGSHCLWSRELFFQKYEGLIPSQLIDVKAITGDGSDNIPGIKGIGWVTVNRLLREYLSVENIYENILKISNKGKVQEKLIENKDRVFLNKQLATINRDAELPTPEPVTVESVGTFLDYLLEELHAMQLANLMGIYFQLNREGNA